MFKPDNSTIREVTLWTLRTTKTKKELMFHMLIQRTVEFNKDGSSDMLTRWKLRLRTELEPEDSRSENHSSSNQDYGWKEFLLITPTTTATSLPGNQERSTTDNSGYMMRLPRLSSLSMRSRIEITKRDPWTSEALTSLSRTLIPDGTNLSPIAQVVTSSPTNLSEPTPNGTDTSKPRLTQK